MNSEKIRVKNDQEEELNGRDKCEKWKEGKWWREGMKLSVDVKGWSEGERDKSEESIFCSAAFFAAVFYLVPILLPFLAPSKGSLANQTDLLG